MRTLIVQTFLTLDGVMQAPGGPDEDPSGGFTHGGWSVHYWDDAMGAAMSEAMSRPFDLLLGRRTYEIFAAHWPHVDDPVARPLNAATKYVASRTLGSVGWANSILLQGDVVEEIRAVKAGDGPEIQVHGSGDLIQTLLANDLVDEFRLWIFPLVLGTGQRLFGGGTVPSNLQLASSNVSTTGVVMTTFRPAGSVPYGSFALEEPTEAELARRAKMAAS